MQDDLEMEPELEFDYASAEALIEKLRSIEEDETVKVKAFFYVEREDFKSKIDAIFVEVMSVAEFANTKLNEMDVYVDMQDCSLTFPVTPNLGRALLQEQDLFKSLQLVG